MQELRLPDSFAETVHTTYRQVADALLAQKPGSKRPLLVAICGCQGSGKSTLAAFLKLILEGEGFPTAILSLDDLYLTKWQRQTLARKIHPLLRTRGVPGTHDVALGLKTLHALREALPQAHTLLPAFDKAQDDRKPRRDWHAFEGRPAFILFEGWCVDAKPQPPASLRKPVNRLERDRDPDGVWRQYVNDQLTGPYRKLFADIDVLVFLKAPSFDCVYEWRGLQEKKLRRPRGGDAGMDKGELENFIMHYERLTRWMLKEMPGRADILLPLARGQHIRAVDIRRSGRRS
jgi:D-glycerate 3-kinase